LSLGLEVTTVRRILLLCGVLSPLLYAVADALAGMRWEGYSFRDQTISELGAIGAPSRPLFSILLIPVYLLLVAFGAGEIMSAVQIAMIAGLPYTALRDAVLTHPTLVEGLIPLFSSVASAHNVADATRTKSVGMR
jgi:hypothetical protein